MSVIITIGIVVLGLGFGVIQRWKYSQDQKLKDIVLEIKKTSNRDKSVTHLEKVN